MKVSGRKRLAILVSALWILFFWVWQLADRFFDFPAFLVIGVGPVLLLWGIRWVVAGFVNNVLDDIGIRQVTSDASADGYRRTAQVTEPRVYGVEITFRYL